MQMAQMLSLQRLKAGKVASGIDKCGECSPIMYVRRIGGKKGSMIEAKDIQSLQAQLEELKAMHIAGGLKEQEVWGVMQRASAMLDEAEGSKFEGCLEVIFHLLSSMWSNTRNQSRLRELGESFA